MAAREQCAELVRQLSAMGAVTRGLSRALPQDCAPASVATLRMLRQYGRMRTGELSERLGVDVSVTSRHVACLANRGWIERRPDPVDRRSQLLSLTPDGDAALREASGLIAEALADFLQDWADDDVTRLAALMARLRESFDDGRPKPLTRPPVGRAVS